jgi:hypothetical protein
MPLIIEEFARIHLRMVASFRRMTRILFDTTKHALNSLDGFFEVLSASDAPLSSPAFLVIVSKIVIWLPNVLDCVDIFDVIHYHFGVLRTNHEVMHMSA